MTLNQWNTLKKCVLNEKLNTIPVALIIDSPWLPGFMELSTIDYFTFPDKWLDANMKVKKLFPEVIFIPDFWVEYGMATEPSGFGCKINFFENNTPTVNHLISSIDEIDRIVNLKIPNPKTDGLMSLALNIYKKIEPKIKDQGESIKIVAARGPLTIAVHLMGLTEFLTGIKMDPVNIHKLLKMTATLTKNWLESQREVLSEVEGILVLDDIVGFLSKEDYLEFAHPYFKDIFNSFSDLLKIYHNDTDSMVCYEFLEELGINIFNFTHKRDILKVRELTGNNIVLMGNIPPLDILAKGNKESVVNSVEEWIEKTFSKKGFLLSAGGGVSPGTPGSNIRAFIDASLNQ